MAIEINSFKFPFSRLEIKDILQRSTDNFGIFIDLDRASELYLRLSLECNSILFRLEEEYGVVMSPSNKNNARLNFAKRFNLPDHMFNKNASKPWLPPSIGFDVKYVISDLLVNPEVPDEAKTVLKLYNQASKAGKGASYLKQYLDAPICAGLAFDNHRMTLVRPKWNILSTGRYSASKPSIQNIPVAFKGLITHPKGYEEIRCDSGQIEPRINFSWVIRDELIIDLIKAYDDAYYGILHFCQMAPEEEAACRADFKANFVAKEITDELKALRKNVKTLTNAGSYGSSDLGHVNRTLADAFDRKLVKHPKRLENEERVKELIQRGADTFYTAFGNAIRPETNTNYDEGTNAWEGHLIRCGVNNPIQGTASDLMCFSVAEADKILKEFPRSHIGYYKHDEGMFYVHEDDMHKLQPLLSEITAYHVKDWIPIECEMEIGRLPYSESYPTVLC